MGGFGFQLGCHAKLDLTFDSMEELEEHPMIGQFAGTTFTEFLENMSPFQRAVLSANPDPPMQFDA